MDIIEDINFNKDTINYLRMISNPSLLLIYMLNLIDKILFKLKMIFYKVIVKLTYLKIFKKVKYVILVIN